VNYTKAYKGIRGIVPLIPNPAQDGGEWAPSQPGRFISGIHFIYLLETYSIDPNRRRP